jgi:hypothetical protein
MSIFATELTSGAASVASHLRRFRASLKSQNLSWETLRKYRTC